MEAFVLLLTAVVMPDVWVLVFEFTEAVPAVIAEASEEEALATVPLTEAVPPVTSDCVAKEPEERPAPVRVLVALPHTAVAVSATRVPKPERVRLV